MAHEEKLARGTMIRPSDSGGFYCARCGSSELDVRTNQELSMVVVICLHCGNALEFSQAEKQDAIF